MVRGRFKMVRRFAVICAVCVASTSAAQSGPPNAAGCRQTGNDYQNSVIKADRAANRTPDVPAIIAKSKAMVRACADSLSTNTTVAELSAMSSLYLYVGDTAKAVAIVEGL